MALYYFHPVLRTREHKQPLLATVAIQAGEPIKDWEADKTYGVGLTAQADYSAVLVPEHCEPITREALWNGVAAIDWSAHEPIALMLTILLPFELSVRVNTALATRYLQRSFLAHQLVVDAVIKSVVVGQGQQPILYVMIPAIRYCESGLTEERFAFTQLGYLTRCRRRWIRYANCELKQAGYRKMQPPHPLLTPKLERMG